MFIVRLPLRLAMRVSLISVGLLVGGCAAPILLLPALGAGGMAVATSDAQQKQNPNIVTMKSTQPAERVFVAASRAIAGMGQLTSSDRSVNIVQGKKGNWIISATISELGKGSSVSFSARYESSRNMDFLSRDAMTKEFFSKLESQLNEKLTGV